MVHSLNKLKTYEAQFAPRYGSCLLSSLTRHTENDLRLKQVQSGYKNCINSDLFSLKIHIHRGDKMTRTERNRLIAYISVSLITSGTLVAILSYYLRLRNMLIYNEQFPLNVWAFLLEGIYWGLLAYIVSIWILHPFVSSMKGLLLIDSTLWAILGARQIYNVHHTEVQSVFSTLNDCFFLLGMLHFTVLAVVIIDILLINKEPISETEPIKGDKDDSTR